MVRKTVLKVFQSLAIGVFVGISAFGILTYFFGGDEANPLPARQSILLGLSAFLVMVVIVVLGGMIDREEARDADRRKKGDQKDGSSGSG